MTAVNLTARTEKNQEIFAGLHDLALNAGHIVLATHQDPDADAIGAVYALAHILRHLDKPVSLFLPDDIPHDLRFLASDAMYFTHTDKLSGDLLIAVDYGDFPRTKLHEYVEQNPIRIATIDHHPRSDHRGEVILVDTTASSTCELIYQYCKFAQIPITRDIATCLLAGIMFDTGALQHSNVSTETLEAAGDLMKYGARIHRVADVLHANYEKPSLRIVAGALSRMQFDEELAMCYTVVSHAELAQVDTDEDLDLSLIIALLGTGTEHKFAAFFKEKEPKKFRVSLRSENFRGVDVSAIARQLGGGGHMYASGCLIEGEFPEVLSRFREVAKTTFLTNNALQAERKIANLV